MKAYSQRTVIQAPLERVIYFHHDKEALKKLSPPFMFIHIYRSEPLAEGSQVDFKMWLGPIPIRWVAVHKNVDSHTGFSDYQKEGPFKYWEHRHTFRAIDAQTSEVIDHVQVELSNNLFWGIVSRFMWINIPLLFAYRGWALRRELESRV